MFIQKITICNLFAYYGEVSVLFNKLPNKRLYCIYGDNGFGKTSFIRCAKLLFAGVGLEENSVPGIISRFAKHKIALATKFLKGDNNWRGILNENAINEAKEQFFVQFEGKLDDRNFILQRSFENIYTQPEEKLLLKIDGEYFYNQEAQDYINKILPPNFVEFFFFDGEEIENISENLRSELRDKIEEILQIKPLDIIIKQAEEIKEKLRDSQNEDEKLKGELQAKKLELQAKKQEFENHTESLKIVEQDINEKQNKINQKILQHQKLGMEVSNEIKELQNDKDIIDENIASLKSSLKEELKSIIFLGNKEICKKLENELENLKNSVQNDDLEALKRLMPDIREIASKEITNLEHLEHQDKIKQLFENILEQLPKKLQQRNIISSFIPSDKIGSLGVSLAKLENNQLASDIQKIKESKNQQTKIFDALNHLNSDDYVKSRQEEIEKEIENLTNKKDEKEQQKDKIKESLKDLEKQKEELQRSIYNLEQNINTERVDKKLKILENLCVAIQAYKNKLINTLRDELKNKIIENYKLLLPNDNITDLSIDESFAMRLNNNKGETIVVESQSSGQKQILAISIFWALNELSRSQIPLIIDTPLSRIDAKNRANIIQNYYAKNQQVIILPHSGEMSLKEYEYAKPYLAGLYKIENNDDRSHATIKVAVDIEEIL